jgi:hypothetical protein
MIYLYAGSTADNCSIKQNPLTYVLLELLSAASEGNEGGE